MDREHCFKQSLCEKGQVWRGGEKLPFTLNLKWQNNKRCCRREGESCSCAGPASPCHSPNKSVRNWLLHFSVVRRQVLATSPSKDWNDVTWSQWLCKQLVTLQSSAIYRQVSMVKFYQSCNPWGTTPVTQQLCPFLYHNRNMYTMFTGHCTKTCNRLLLQSAVNSQTLKQADGIFAEL